MDHWQGTRITKHLSRERLSSGEPGLLTFPSGASVSHPQCFVRLNSQPNGSPLAVPFSPSPNTQPDSLSCGVEVGRTVSQRRIHLSPLE